MAHVETGSKEKGKCSREGAENAEGETEGNGPKSISFIRTQEQANEKGA